MYNRNSAGCRKPPRSYGYTVIFDMGRPVTATGVRLAGWRSVSHNPASVTWYACTSTRLSYNRVPSHCRRLGTYAHLSRFRTRANYFAVPPLLKTTALVPMRRYPDNRHLVEHHTAGTGAHNTIWVTKSTETSSEQPRATGHSIIQCGDAAAIRATSPKSVFMALMPDVLSRRRTAGHTAGHAAGHAAVRMGGLLRTGCC